MEKSFSLNFLQANQSIDMDQEWKWQPENGLNGTEIKTATFCGKGKNQADDYQTE